MEDVFVGVGTEPGDHGFAYDVVFGYVAPVTGIFGIVAVVAHHPVVIHFKGIGIGFLAVYRKAIAWSA